MRYTGRVAVSPDAGTAGDVVLSQLDDFEREYHRSRWHTTYVQAEIP